MLRKWTYSQACFYVPFMFFPVIITEPGNYKTREGLTVTITASSDGLDHGCTGFYPNGVREGWHRSGRLYPSRETCNDIVEKLL